MGQNYSGLIKKRTKEYLTCKGDIFTPKTSLKSEALLDSRNPPPGEVTKTRAEYIIVPQQSPTRNPYLNSTKKFLETVLGFTH